MKLKSIKNKKITRILVIGIGGCGHNAVNQMILSNHRGVTFAAIDMYSQDLNFAKAPLKILIGNPEVPSAGFDGGPKLGEIAAEESIDLIRRITAGTDMVIIIAGLSGLTGTGAAPVVAQACMEAEILTIGVVTWPVAFEGYRRRRYAENGLKALAKTTDIVIKISNNRLREWVSRDTTIGEFFQMTDEIIHKIVKGICDLLTKNTIVPPVDTENFKINSNNHMFFIEKEGSGNKNGPLKTLKKVIFPQFVEDISVSIVKGLLTYINCKNDLKLSEMAQILRHVTTGARNDKKLVSIVAFGGILHTEARAAVTKTESESRRDHRQTRLKEKTTAGRNDQSNFQEKHYSCPDIGDLDIPIFLRMKNKGSEN